MGEPYTAEELVGGPRMYDEDGDAISREDQAAKMNREFWEVADRDAAMGGLPPLTEAGPICHTGGDPGDWDED